MKNGEQYHNDLFRTDQDAGREETFRFTYENGRRFWPYAPFAHAYPSCRDRPGDVSAQNYDH